MKTMREDFQDFLTSLNGMLQHWQNKENLVHLIDSTLDHWYCGLL